MVLFNLRTEFTLSDYLEYILVTFNLGLRLEYGTVCVMEF